MCFQERTAFDLPSNLAVFSFIFKPTIDCTLRVLSTQKEESKYISFPIIRSQIGKLTRNTPTGWDLNVIQRQTFHEEIFVLPIAIICLQFRNDPLSIRMIHNYETPFLPLVLFEKICMQEFVNNKLDLTYPT